MRNSEDLHGEGDGRSRPVQPLIPEDKLEPTVPLTVATMGLSTTSTRQEPDIREALKRDPMAQDIIQILQNNAKSHRTVPLGECDMMAYCSCVASSTSPMTQSPDSNLKVLSRAHCRRVPRQGCHLRACISQQLVAKDATHAQGQNPHVMRLMDCLSHWRPRSGAGHLSPWTWLPTPAIP